MLFTDKTNKGLSSLVARIAAIAIFGGLLSTVLTARAQQSDLITGSDMVESPLSISLNTQAITVNDELVLIAVNQFGVSNITSIAQAGDGANLTNVTQNGNDNTALITQLGEGNVVNLLQQNDSNYFEIIQDGFDNVANVNQLGEQSFIVHQIGNEMVINITQYKQ